MTLRREPDGTLIGTPDEIIEYDVKLRRAGLAALVVHSPSPPDDESSSPPRKRRGRRASEQPHETTWSQTLAHDFLSKTTPRTRETLDAALKVGDGASSKALAEALGSSFYGIGKRVEKAKIDALFYSETLPAPIRLVGKGGHKLVAIEPSFLEALRGLGAHV